jgi:hypothetical protein
MATSARFCGRPVARLVASRCRLMKALPSQMVVVPDSCALFPIRARYSQFVRAIPDSCALFPIRARFSRFVRDTGLRRRAAPRTGRGEAPGG